ncbi:unnamed protein product [Cylindrotheca closterium]|uniref:N-acetyltransferase domain-containing protein n=1 Tax=Cylindrotheca closterium TaxID=2856 RepID=A0AAD2FPD7_9STRA|nr:unnamed protein product [Cylindrotheca closterium]
MSSPQPYHTMLTSAVTHKHMEDLIQKVNPQLSSETGWSLRRVVLSKDAISSTSQDVVLWTQYSEESSSPGNPAHYYGMVLSKTNTEGISNTGEQDDETESSSTNQLLISFYLAYSTWDGRCLHVDQFPSREECPATVKPVFLLQSLAQLAIQLGCRRVLWMQKGDPNWSFVVNDGLTPTDGSSSKTSNVIKPETLDEWLILKLDRKAMESYAGGSSSDNGSQASEPAAEATGEALDRPTIETKIQQVCADLQSTSSSSLKWRLVLEQSAMGKDTNSIFKLVQGLAEYENEPDAVQCRARDYQLDGSGSHPLFYCLLLEDTTTTTNTTCGMAFFYFGYTSNDGRFLCLEDLYLEPAFRQKGGGTLALKALAKIGMALECSYLLWTALDWNQPALNLYAKMGAVVQDGLKISRYKDEELLRFANAGISKS